jgi:hypothetical protein
MASSSPECRFRLPATLRLAGPRVPLCARRSRRLAWRSLPFYEFTTELATLQPLPPDLERVLDAVHGDQDAMDGFARVGGAVTSPGDFFSEQNVQRLLAGAGQRSP